MDNELKKLLTDLGEIRLSELKKNGPLSADPSGLLLCEGKKGLYGRPFLQYTAGDRRVNSSPPVHISSELQDYIRAEISARLREDQDPDFYGQDVALQEVFLKVKTLHTGNVMLELVPAMYGEHKLSWVMVPAYEARFKSLATRTTAVLQPVVVKGRTIYGTTANQSAERKAIVIYYVGHTSPYVTYTLPEPDEPFVWHKEEVDGLEWVKKIVQNPRTGLHYSGIPEEAYIHRSNRLYQALSEGLEYSDFQLTAEQFELFVSELWDMRTGGFQVPIIE